MSSHPHTPPTPLLTDEELDALIQAFNRREPIPRFQSTARVWLCLLTLSMIGLGWWWV